MRTLLDFEDLVRPYFVGHEEKLEKAEKEIARKLLLDFKEIKEWKSDAILEIFRKEIATGKATMKTFYKIFMGRDSGLPLPAFLEILGKQKTLERLRDSTK
jgi:lysyl-tRNA synthetase class I